MPTNDLGRVAEDDRRPTHPRVIMHTEMARELAEAGIDPADSPTVQAASDWLYRYDHAVLDQGAIETTGTVRRKLPEGEDEN